GVGADAGDLALHLFGGLNRLNLTVGIGVHHDVVLSEVGGIKGVGGLGGAVQSGQGDVLVVLVHLQDLGGIVVDNGYVHGLLGAVHIDLGQHTVAGGSIQTSLSQE